MRELELLQASFGEAKIIDCLMNGQFIAPKYVHNQIEQKLVALATLCDPISIDISDTAFSLIAKDQIEPLISVGFQHKCLIEIQVTQSEHDCEIPRALVKDHVSNALTASVIDVCQGDLAEQKVIV
jgi:hypothetical protein